MPKCKIKMGDKVLPVEGSIKGTGVDVTGTCPECKTPGVVLSVVGGYIRAHVIADREIPENNPQAPTLIEPPVKYGKGLSESQTELTDTGVRIGDPRGALQRRTVEIHGINGTGTVQVPREHKGEDGKKRKKLTDVPATEENVREALAYWHKRKPRSDASRAKQREMISLLTRWAEAFRQDPSVMTAQSADSASVHRGPTLVRGRDTTPRLRDPELSWDEPTDLRQNGQVRKSTTFEQPLGRERFDRKITDVPEPKRKRTASERRRYRRMLKAGDGRRA